MRGRILGALLLAAALPAHADPPSSVAPSSVAPSAPAPEPERDSAIALHAGFGFGRYTETTTGLVFECDIQPTLQVSGEAAIAAGRGHLILQAAATLGLEVQMHASQGGATTQQNDFRQEVIELSPRYRWPITPSLDVDVGYRFTLQRLHFLGVPMIGDALETVMVPRGRGRAVLAPHLVRRRQLAPRRRLRAQPRQPRQQPHRGREVQLDRPLVPARGRAPLSLRARVLRHHRDAHRGRRRPGDRHVHGHADAGAVAEQHDVDADGRRQLPVVKLGTDLLHLLRVLVGAVEREGALPGRERRGAIAERELGVAE